MRYGKLALVIVSITAFAVAIAKTSCIYFGEQCYSVQMAPEFIVESARAGTWVAPVGAIVASTIFIVIGLYALSAAGIVRRLPLLRPVVLTLSTLFVIRGLLPLQLWIRKPELVSDNIIVIGVIWLLCGLMLFWGYKATQVK
ncbi:hypothetical protein JQC92_16835 [Shewanella sp. 202IG2-18]|uniref:hypothetical protein n=1 Tax=Parashewanella hymeniacidonis TaxID=2807618 RepID=UPI001961BDD8|nr:hypothetical protein [Parashewanella hymeniacidonis]MBM7073677.1 hypothetical protein [Parashewanella hymeniacidonis]